MTGMTNSVRDFGQYRNKPDKREMKPASFRNSVEMKPASFRYIGFSVEIQPASFRYNRLHFDTSASASHKSDVRDALSVAGRRRVKTLCRRKKLESTKAHPLDA